MKLPEDSIALEYVDKIERAARRAADLASQMLAYSGRGALETRVLNLSRLVDEMSQLVDVSIGKNVQVTRDLDFEFANVDADPNQMRQVVLNLVTNASEGIGDEEGAISLRTGRVELSERDIQYLHCATTLQPRQYVFLDVQDSGVGMDTDTVACVFDPFFTTKVGGRGLGLAVVLGIVRGHRGDVVVTSKPDEGATFRVLLPFCDRPREDRHVSDTALSEQSVDGTILVIDDEKSVFDTASSILRRSGYEVFEESVPEAGIELFKRHVHETDAVLLDLTMPRLSGEDVLQEIRFLRADIPVVLMSGFSEAELMSRSKKHGLSGALRKPFSTSQLLHAISQAVALRD